MIHVDYLVNKIVNNKARYSVNSKITVQKG
ncbi:uncharacterized protein METZ01_LOCUS317384 [marine metagenome]|uniref:Uncharacterized protein n=1 Tax=marine metagenome TaxID=408172 RepID=A0A382NV47_9ZZZZ